MNVSEKEGQHFLKKKERRRTVLFQELLAAYGTSSSLADADIKSCLEL